jgi:hypothetical protein
VAAGDMTKAAGERPQGEDHAAPADGCGLPGKLASARPGQRQSPATASRPGRTLSISPPPSCVSSCATARRSADRRRCPGVAYDIVTKAIVGAVKTDPDAAVAAGKLTQAREDRILERLERLLANGRMPGGQAAITKLVAVGSR